MSCSISANVLECQSQHSTLAPQGQFSLWTGIPLSPPFLLIPPLSLSLSLSLSLQVILDYEYVPHYVQERDPGGGASISDDSALTPPSQAFSPMTLGDDAGNSAHYRRQTNHTHSEGYVTSGEGEVNDLQYTSSVSRGVLMLMNFTLHNFYWLICEN